MDLKSMAMTRNMMPMMGDEVVANVGFSNKGINDVKTDQYPECLKLELHQDILTMLGISEMPQIDSEIDMVAKVKVVGIESEEGGHCLELQITSMSLGKPQNKKDMQETLYGEQKAGG